MSNESSTVNLTEEKIVNELGWWRKRTSLEQKLCLSLLCATALCVGFVATTSWLFVLYHTKSPIFKTARIEVAALSSPATRERSNGGVPVCLTPGCIKAANDIIVNMDPTVDPCNDFYEYACGGFIKSHYIDDTKTSIGKFSMISEKLTQQLKSIIEEPETPSDTELLVKMKNFYESCLNDTKIKEIGITPLEDLMEQLGGWPVILGDKWDSKNFSWQSLMFAFNRANIPPNSFVSFRVTKHLTNDTLRVMLMSAPSFPLPKAYLKAGLKHSHIRAYYNYLIKAAVFFGAEPIRATKEMEEVLRFITELSQLLPPDERVSNISKLYEPMTLTELQKKVPDVDWKAYLETIQPNKLTPDEFIYVTELNYTMNFTKLLAKTDPRILANFAVGQVIRSLAPYVSEEFERMSFQSFQKVSGLKQRTSRWRKCLSKTKDLFSVAIAQAYVREFFPAEAKPVVEELTSLIQEAMHDILKKVNWVDSVTLDRALKKLNATDAMVVYPEELLDDVKVSTIYENFTVDRETYFENIRSYQNVARDKQWSRLRKPIVYRDWKKRASVAIVNAFYSPTENSIILPAGILQGTFFGIDRPQYSNFATLGTVIGHELTHGFDDRGRQFDLDGRLVNWWEPETNKKFQEKTECMIQQYNNYTSPAVNISLNGKNTIGENIADNGGLKASYNAYQRWIKKHGKELPLPGLNFTSNQLFWISYANLWCNKVRPESLKESIRFGLHSIARFRVNGPLSNMANFAQDYQCPEDSPLNPTFKCSVW